MKRRGECPGRERVMDEVARTRQMPPGAPAEPTAAPRRRWPMPLAAAAALVVVALLATLVVRQMAC